MQRLFAKKKESTASLPRKRSESSFALSTTPSDLQAEKSAPYKNPSYESVLAREAGSYMDKYKPGITEASERFCQSLLDNKQVIPMDTIFRDDIFDDTCEKLRGKNKARIFKDCTPLIVPWVEAHVSLSANRALILRLKVSIKVGTIRTLSQSLVRSQIMLLASGGLHSLRISLGSSSLSQGILHPPPTSWVHIICTFLSSHAKSNVVLRDLISQIDKTFIV